MTATTEARLYRVTLRKQFPAWDERNGIVFEVEARSKADAVKSARYEAYNGGHTGSGCGRCWFKAVEADTEN